MKFRTFVFLFILIAGLSSCINRADYSDIMAPTPTDADTVLPDTHHHFTVDEMQAYEKTLPRVYWR